MNITPVEQPNFGVYTISKNYIRFLRKAEPNVTDPELTNTYCGPVCRTDTPKGPVDYFVPIDAAKFTENEFVSVFFENGIFADIMDFKAMIPCLPSEYNIDTSNVRLTEFCNVEKEHIQQCAESVMHSNRNS